MAIIDLMWMEGKGIWWFLFQYLHMFGNGTGRTIFLATLWTDPWGSIYHRVTWLPSTVANRTVWEWGSVDRESVLSAEIPGLELLCEEISRRKWSQRECRASSPLAGRLVADDCVRRNIAEPWLALFGIGFTGWSIRYIDLLTFLNC